MPCFVCLVGLWEFTRFFVCFAGFLEACAVGSVSEFADIFSLDLAFLSSKPDIEVLFTNCDRYWTKL